jgi:hypothetical protein
VHASPTYLNPCQARDPPVDYATHKVRERLMGDDRVPHEGWP